MERWSEVQGIGAGHNTSSRRKQGKKIQPSAVALIGVILFLATFLAVVASAGTWRIQTIDSAAGLTADEAEHTSIALDSSGHPHISYYDRSFNDLGYARFDGNSWTVQVVDSEGHVGGYSSLALDSLDRPHISYLWISTDLSVKRLKYAQFNSTSWGLTVVDDSFLVGEYTSLALDSSGYPHISYSDAQNFALKYASFNGSLWMRSTLESGGVGSYISLALDASDRPHISYLDYSYSATGGYDLRYYSGAAGAKVTVDPSGIDGLDSSIAVDSNGHPHISYIASYDGWSTFDLKYAHFNGSSWNITTVETDVQRGTAIALDASGKPHIVYKKWGDFAVGLNYARFNGTTWVKEQIEDHAGYSPSLALDSGGNAHVSFYSFDPACDGYICLQYASVTTPPPALFDDVPAAHWAYSFVTALSNAGITGGCSSNPPLFCPDESITRAQMAVFIEAFLGHPANPCTNRFADAPLSSPFCGFIERMADDGITSGCGGMNFCPDAPVTRGQMAVFIEAALGHTSTTCTAQFADVPAFNPFCRFIEHLAADAITGGCGGTDFCPNSPVTRAQMAVFLGAAPSPLNP